MDFFSKLLFDPLEFAGDDSKKQVKMLLSVVNLGEIK